MGTQGKLEDRIRMATISNIESFRPSYNKEADSLLLQKEPAIPAVSVDWNGEFMLRINPANGEIVGVEIEAYKKFFVKKYRKELIINDLDNPLLNSLIMASVLSGKKASTYKKSDFMKDLAKVCQPINRR